jgi:hypothetical protein
MVYPGQEVMHNSGGWKGNYKGGLSSFISALPQDVIEHRSFVSSYPPAIATLATISPTPAMHERAGVFPDNAMLKSTPFTKSMDPLATDSSGLKPGDRVNHPAFGKGVIAKFLDEDRVEVIFQDRGIKLLHLGYTSLEKI